MDREESDRVVRSSLAVFDIGKRERYRQTLSERERDRQKGRKVKEEANNK